MAILVEIETPVGAIDGTNTTFVISRPYIPGSVRLFWDGLIRLEDNDDGVIETDPTTGTVDLREAPIVGDTLKIFYQYQLVDNPILEIDDLCIEIEAVQDVIIEICDCE